MNVSLTGGTVLEFGIDLRPACGPDDVERVLEACDTGEEFAACLHAFVHRDEDQATLRQSAPSPPEQRPLIDEEFARARRLVDAVFGES